MIAIHIGCDVVVEEFGGTCGTTLYTGTPDLTAAVRQARASGWRPLNNRGQWTCGTHGLPARRTS